MLQHVQLSPHMALIGVKEWMCLQLTVGSLAWIKGD